jgi:hypothetical protein
MGIDYTREKLYSAVNTLATSALPLGKRLEYAWTGALVRLEPSDFPEEHAEEFASLREASTKAGPSSGEGSIAHTMRTLREEELADIAERIWGLFSALCDPLFTERKSAPEDAPAKPKSPRKKR